MREILKRIVPDWYDAVGVRVISSDKAYEYYAGKKVENKEFAGLFESKDIDADIPLLEKILAFIEKNELVQGDDPYSPVFERFVFKGVLGQTSALSEAESQIEEYLGDRDIDREIKNMVDDVWGNGQSVIFQRRIPWELTKHLDKPDTFCVYGRFVSAII